MDRKEKKEKKKKAAAPGLSFDDDAVADHAGGGAVVLKKKRRKCDVSRSVDEWKAVEEPKQESQGGAYDTKTLEELRKQSFRSRPVEDSEDVQMPDEDDPPRSMPPAAATILSSTSLPSTTSSLPSRVPSQEEILRLKRARRIRASNDSFIPLERGEPSTRMLDETEDPEESNLYHSERPVVQPDSDEEADMEASRQFEAQQLQRASISSSLLDLERASRHHSRTRQQRGAEAFRSAEGPTAAAVSSPAPKKERREMDVEGYTASFDEQLAKLKQQIGKMREYQSAHRQGLQQQKQNAHVLQSNILDVEMKLKNKAKFFHFVQEQKEYFDALGECFEDKMSAINGLLEQQCQAHASFYKTRLLNRVNWAEDEQEDVQLLFGGSLRPELIDGLAGTDEMGRDLSIVRQLEKKQRTEARIAHRRIKRRRREKHPIEQPDGWSSSEDSLHEGERKRFEEALHSGEKCLDRLREGILKDVSSDFATLEKVRDRLQQWKTDDLQSYLSVGQPSLALCFEPFVKIELSKWSPIINPTKVSDMEWWKALEQYSHGDSMEATLRSFIVIETVIPHFTSHIEACFDPASYRHTLNVIATITDLMPHACQDGMHQNMKDAMQMVIDRVRSLLDSIRGTYVVNDQLISFSTPDTKPLPDDMVGDPSKGTHAAFHSTRWCLWHAAKIMSNLRSWQGVMADRALADLSVGSAFGEVIATHLITSPSETFEDIEEISRIMLLVLDLVPAAWVVPERWEGNPEQQRIVRERTEKVRELLAFVAEKFKQLRNSTGQRNVSRPMISAAKKLSAVCARLGDHYVTKQILG